MTPSLKFQYYLLSQRTFLDIQGVLRSYAMLIWASCDFAPPYSSNCPLLTISQILNVIQKENTPVSRSLHPSTVTKGVHVFGLLYVTTI